MDEKKIRRCAHCANTFQVAKPSMRNRFCTRRCARLGEIRRIEPVASRFWSQVNVGPTDECWIWTGGISDNGYGKFWADGKTVNASRYALLISTGTDAGLMSVCHRCDNPPCCNPAHLFIGTTLDNMRDKVLKGRQARGSLSGRAVLDEAAVSDIRARVGAGEGQRAIAKELGVSPSTVCDIVRGRSWAWLKA